MKKQAGLFILIVMLAFLPLLITGCDDGGGGGVVVVDDGVYYAPATVQNNSPDDVIVSSDMFGDIYLPPGSAVDLDIGPNVDRLVIYLNGVFFEELFVASGDVIVFE
jgi:hypothetical protein